MNPSQVACLLLLLSMGEIRLTLADSGTQPVDAVLLIDGAPTYLRLTNSTSLEAVYSCVLENSQNVNSVIMSTQIKGVKMDVGQIEDNVKEVIRLLSAEAGSNGRALWKSPEELKLFKMRLARYLTANYYDGKSVTERNTYSNFKSQRSADRLYKNWDHQSGPNLYRAHLTRWEQTQEPYGRQYSVVSVNAPYFVTPELNERRGMTPTGSVSIPSTTPVPERIITPDAAVASPYHRDSSAAVDSTSVTAEQHTPSNTSTRAPDLSNPSPTTDSAHSGIYPFGWIYGGAPPFSAYGKADPEIATESVKETEATTISSEGLFGVEQSNFPRLSVPATNFPEIEENPGEIPSPNKRRLKIGSVNGTTILVGRTDSNGTLGEGGYSNVNVTESEKPRKTKGKRRNSRKRVAKSRQQPSMMTSDPKANED